MLTLKEFEMQTNLVQCFQTLRRKHDYQCNTLLAIHYMESSIKIALLLDLESQQV